MTLKLKYPNTITYPSKAMRWEEEKEELKNVNDEAMDSSVNVLKKKRRPANLCIECPVCGGPAPDHLHFGGQSCYSCRAFFRRTSPRPVSSFSCRSGLNNCSINSGSKSCIPCRLTKCLQIGMDPNLVRGKKCKGDSDYEDTINHQDDEDNPWLATKPPLKPRINSESFENSQQSLLRLRADFLEYQGLCLQYQASILEKQARSMGDNKEATFYTDTMEYHNHVVEPKNFQHNTSMEHIKSEPEYEYEAKYVAEHEAKYNQPMVEYGTNQCLSMENDGGYTQYDLGRYPSNGNEYVGIRDNEYTLRDNAFTLRDSKYTRGDRLPRCWPTASHHVPLDVLHSNVPRPAPYKHLEESDTREEVSRCESAGPLDLSVKKSTPSSQLHTQAHNMPRIFFRLGQNRI